MFSTLDEALTWCSQQPSNFCLENKIMKFAMMNETGQPELWFKVCTSLFGYVQDFRYALGVGWGWDLQNDL